MSAAFIELLNMSLSASIMILAVVFLRAVFKKIPKSLICVLWGLVGLRLVCPFSVRSAVSLLPSAAVIRTCGGEQPPEVVTGIPAVDSSVNSAAGNGGGADVFRVLMFVWAVGVLLLTVYSVVSFLRLKHKVSSAVPLEKKIWLCDYISAPFVLGIFSGRIFLPSGIREEKLACVIAHESSHLKRHDNLWKPLGFAILTLHWFNPVVWLAYLLFCRDLEFACDERAVELLNSAERAVYSETLLLYSLKRGNVSAFSLAFGGAGVRQRVVRALKYHKPRKIVIAVIFVLCLAFSVCFLTNPADKTLVTDHEKKATEEVTEKVLQNNIKPVLPKTTETVSTSEKRAATEGGKETNKKQVAKASSRQVTRGENSDSTTEESEEEGTVVDAKEQAEVADGNAIIFGNKKIKNEVPITEKSHETTTEYSPFGW